MRLIFFLFLFIYSCASELKNKNIISEQDNDKAQATFSIQTDVGLKIE